MEYVLTFFNFASKLLKASEARAEAKTPSTIKAAKAVRTISNHPARTATVAVCRKRVGEAKKPDCSFGAPHGQGLVLCRRAFAVIQNEDRKKKTFISGKWRLRCSRKEGISCVRGMWSFAGHIWMPVL